MKIWRLKRGGDRRLRQGHPWVFASELAHSAKEIEPGGLVQLHDDKDHFLAFGYGHPTSQICFRKLSGNAKEKDVGSVEFFVRRLARARALRALSGWTAFSHRWLFGEGDGVPGLIVDLFKRGESSGSAGATSSSGADRGSSGWIAVVQASTAGADRMLPQVFEALKAFEQELGGNSAPLTIIEAPSSRSRAIEGLAITEKRIISGPPVAREQLLLRDGVKMSADMIGGQKTGFFLDQQWNVGLLKGLLPTQVAASEGRPLRILDICCYVGQWGTHLAQAAGGKAEVVLLDTSEAALEMATANVGAYASKVTAICTDVMQSLGAQQPESFDVVVCDPPAFVKKRADLEAGLRAYVKLNREALRLVRPGGLLLSSSCSGLVKSADFNKALGEACGKAGRAFQQILNGGHAPDHPVRPDFPEGEYLKAVIGRVDYPV
jgi:23S rRNA (cytosine1962-C5)-methyltransferase